LLSIYHTLTFLLGAASNKNVAISISSKPKGAYRSGGLPVEEITHLKNHPDLFGLIYTFSTF
jgi:hypothetical protein